MPYWNNKLKRLEKIYMNNACENKDYTFFMKPHEAVIPIYY